MTATIIVLAMALALGPTADGSAGDDAPTSSSPTSQDDDVPAEQRAAEMFEAGRYSEAAKWFRTAYERTGEPAFLYGRAQALRRAGNCRAAIDVLELFIETSPPHADIVVAQDIIDACYEILRRGVEADTASTTEDDRSARSHDVHADDGSGDTRSEDTDGAQKPSWRRDLAGGLLLGGGLVTLSTGAALTGSAFAVARPRDERETAFIRRQGRVRALTTSGIVIMAAGTALVIGAIVRYAIVARRDPQAARRGPRAIVRF